MASQTESTPDTLPLSAFRDNPTELLERVRATRRPITLTVDGKAEVVIQEAAEYERMLDLLEAAEVREAIRHGLADVEAGRTRPVEEFFDDMRRKYAIPG